MSMECDVCVIGGGSGGIGATIGAASRGASVILLEKYSILGGTTTLAWVHTWEPTCGCAPLCRRLWDRMQALGGAEKRDYEASSRRMNAAGKISPSLPFEPWAFLLAVDAELQQAGAKQVLLNTAFAGCSTDGRTVKSIQALGPAGAMEVRAKVFIDCTADIFVARAAACKVAKGAESRNQYHEPHAPDKADPLNLNSMNWNFRIRDGRIEVTLPEPESYPREVQRPGFQVRMPNGDYLVNPLGMICADPDDPAGFAQATDRARQLAFDNYRWSVLKGGYKKRVLVGMAPAIGVRETYRLVGRYVLTENDVVAGREKQAHKDIAASSDHPLDAHGQYGFFMELKAGYGIPFRCLQAVEYDNLLVACRGASFSHIAASSCRLGRTMISLGEAAGTVAAEAVRAGKLIENVEIANVLPQ